MTAAVIKFERPAPQTKLPEKNRPEDSPTAFKSDAAYLRTLFSETYWTLPFVTMPTEECGSWAEFWKRAVMWNDEPTDNPHADFWRGRRYAFLAIEAIRKDKTCGRQLKITVDRMIEGAFSEARPFREAMPQSLRGGAGLYRLPMPCHHPAGLFQGDR
jgi:hypothetical protein